MHIFKRICNDISLVRTFYQLRRKLSEFKGNTNAQEKKINVNGHYINYLKIGSGECPVLLLPGFLGTIRTNFGPQIENLDRTKFTIVGWEPPGYGNSKPHNRSFPTDSLKRDAVCAKSFMQALGYETFSMIGWCDGGVTACLLAGMYPDSIKKMIVIATRSFISPEDAAFFRECNNTEYFPKGSFLESLYDKNYYNNLHHSWNDMMLDCYENQKGNVCLDYLENIKCPTLIVHGTEDTYVPTSHAAFLNSKIQRSRVKIFENGRHNPHIKYSEEFNQIATDFMLSSE